MPKIECEVTDNQITATTDYDPAKLLPEHHDFIHKQITDYLSRVQVRLASENPCPNDCKYYKGHLFKLFTGTQTWKNAQAACEARGGHLATSTDAEKNAFLTTVAGGKRAWLGGTDEAGEGDWKWITGEDWSYTKWNTGEPNNSDGAEHYLELNYGTSGRWNDLSATSKLGYLCECEYTPRIVVDPQGISHELLSDLLGGSEEGHYHLTEDEKTKLERLMTGGYGPEVDEPYGEAGDVYAIGYYADVWSNNALPDDYGFKKLPMPKIKRLVEYGTNTFTALTENSGWYTYGTFSLSPLPLTNTIPSNINIPTEIQIDGITAILAGSLPKGTLCTCYLDSTSNCYVYINNSAEPVIVPNVRKLSCDSSAMIAIVDEYGEMVHNIVNGTISKIPTGLPADSIKEVGWDDNKFVILTTDGEVYEKDTSFAKPAKKIEFPYRKVKAIFSTKQWGNSFFVLTEDDELYAKGYSANYILGLPNSTNVFTKVGNYKVKRICSRKYETFMLLEDGTLWHTSTYNQIPIYRITDSHQGFEQIFPDLKFLDIAYVQNTLVVIRETPKETADWDRIELPKNLYQYKCFPDIGRMYYGTIAYVQSPYLREGLLIPLLYYSGVNAGVIPLFTEDLARWIAYAAFYSYQASGFNTITTLPIHADNFYVDWNKGTTNSNYMRMFYPIISHSSIHNQYVPVAGNTSEVVVLNTPHVVAGCYSPELREVLIVSADGQLTRIQDTSTTNAVTPTKITETPPDCGITPNLGCLKWSPAAGVFCVTGTNGVATSPTGEAGSWAKSPSAPENLNGLEYREDIDGGSFIAWSAADKHIYTSKQGLSWTRYSTNPIPLDSVASVAYSPEFGMYCAAPQQGNKAYISKDLNAWTSTKISNRENLGVNGVIWMPSTQKFVLLPTDGYVFYTYSPEE